MDGLKRFLPFLKKMGYNCDTLYSDTRSQSVREGFWQVISNSEEWIGKDALCIVQQVTTIPSGTSSKSIRASKNVRATANFNCCGSPFIFVFTDAIFDQKCDAVSSAERCSEYKFLPLLIRSCIFCLMTYIEAKHSITKSEKSLIKLRQHCTIRMIQLYHPNCALLPWLLWVVQNTN